MTQSVTEQMRELADQLTASRSGVRTELTEFASGGAMLDVYCSNGRAFVMAYSPTAGYGVDELRADEGFEFGYRFVVGDLENAASELRRLLIAPTGVAATSASLNLVVVYARDVEAATRFYSSLGLTFQSEQHGTGPIHFAAATGDAVMEIYPSSDGNNRGAVRLGFQVQSLEQIVNELRTHGAKIVAEPKESPWGQRAVIEDPDGNRVELTQSAARLVSA